MESPLSYKCETEQELLTTSAELKEQFNEIQANWKIENTSLIARIAYLEDEFMELGVGRREVDRQTELLQDIRNMLKLTIRNMYGWEYAINMVIPNNKSSTIVSRTLGHVWDDMEKNRQVLAYAVKHNFQSELSHCEEPYDSPQDKESERRSAREIRQKIAKDSLTFKPKYSKSWAC